MVLQLNQSFRGSFFVPLTAGRSWEVLGSPQPGFVPIPRLAVVREHLQTAGFSVSTADRISLPQRDSKGRLYNAKWEEFWGRQRKTDPVSADVPVVAEFLEHLFQ